MAVLLFAGLGLAGGAFAARLAELRVYLVPVSAGFLGLGYYFAYWRRFGGHRQRVVLWIATGLAVLLWTFPTVRSLILP